MTKNELRIAIEKNRTALLRLVLCWLVAASVFKVIPNRILPRRMGRWASEMIHKAELAAYYLRKASGLTAFGEEAPIFDDSPTDIATLIMRLKALKRTLIALRHSILIETPRTHAKNTKCTRRSAQFSANRRVLLKTQYCSPNTRAPPETISNLSMVFYRSLHNRARQRICTSSNLQTNTRSL